MRTLRQAARALGIDYKTLSVWLRQAGISEDRLERDSLDSRLRYIPEDVLQGIAAEHGRTVDDPNVAPAPPEVMARLERLEQRFNRLENDVRQAIAGYLSGTAMPALPEVVSIAPDGVALRAFASRHGINQSTARNQELTGRIQTTQAQIPGRPGERSHTLTYSQQVKALEVWRAVPTYRACDVPDCPCHDDD